MAPTAFDAHVVPIYDGRYRIVFPIFAADGSLVTAAAGLDSEVSKDQGTFVDCVNEAVEIASLSGVYRLDLTADEMQADGVTVICKSTAGKITILFFNPNKLPILRSATTTVAAGATSITLDAGASAIDDYYANTYIKIQSDTPAGARGQARRITNYNGTTKVASIEGAWGTTPASGTSFFILAHPMGHMSAASIPLTVANKIADHILRRSWTTAFLSGDGDTFNFRSLLGAVAKLVNRIYYSGGSLHITRENDLTDVATQTATTDTSAQPVTDLDTV